MGKTSSEQLQIQMAAVDKFVEDTKLSAKNEQMTLVVKSHALKRQLAREIAIKYKESANVFTEFKKNSDQFILKKWAKRNNTGMIPASQAKKAQNPEDTKTKAASEESKQVDAATIATISTQDSTQALTEQMSQLSL
jgi:hypothetical protein